MYDFFFLFPCRNMIKLNQRPNFTWLNLHNLKSKVHQIIFFFFVYFCIHEEWGYFFMCFYCQKWIHLFSMSLQLINEKKSCHAIHWCLRAFLHWWKSCSLGQISVNTNILQMQMVCRDLTNFGRSGQIYKRTADKFPPGLINKSMLKLSIICRKIYDQRVIELKSVY